MILLVGPEERTGRTGVCVQIISSGSEDNTQKGLTPAQITGSCSSYARKYALNGLLAIDDVQDDDSRDNRTKEQKDVDVNALRKQMYPSAENSGNMPF